jgi:hypothetical protein
VGAVVMNNSDDTYRLGNFRNAAVGSFPKKLHGLVRSRAGRARRTAWDAFSTGGGMDVLGADLDLCVIRNDTGATVVCSLSIQNAWEKVDFTAPVTGTYTIRVNRFSSVVGWPGTLAPRGRYAHCRPSAR